MIMSSTDPIPKAPRPRSQNRRRDVLLMAGLFLAVVAGLVGLAVATGWQETVDQIARLSLYQMLGLLVLSLVNYSIRGLRWHIFVQRLGIRTGFWQDFRHYLGGFAMTVTPGRIGELVRMRWLYRETGWSFEKTAPLTLIDRASDLAALALILGLALMLSSTGIFGALPVAILALIAALISTRPRMLAALADLGYRVLKRWPRLFAKVRTAARSLGKFSNLALMSTTTFLGIIGWFAEIYAFYVLLGWMGAEVRLPVAAAIFVFSTIAGSLTGAPGGVGGAEAAMIALLSLEGVPLETSLPATAIIRVTTLWFAIGIGLVVFPYAERQSKKGSHGLE